MDGARSLPKEPSYLGFMLGISGKQNEAWDRDNPEFTRTWTEVAAAGTFPFRGELTRTDDDGVTKFAVIDEGAVSVTSVSDQITETAKNVWALKAFQAGLTSAALVGGAFCLMCHEANGLRLLAETAGTVALLVLGKCAARRALEASNRFGAWDTDPVLHATEQRVNAAALGFNRGFNANPKTGTPLAHAPLTPDEVELLWRDELAKQTRRVKDADVRECNLSFLQDRALQLALGPERASQVTDDASQALKLFERSNNAYQEARMTETELLDSPPFKLTVKGLREDELMPQEAARIPQADVNAIVRHLEKVSEVLNTANNAISS